VRQCTVSLTVDGLVTIKILPDELEVVVVDEESPVQSTPVVLKNHRTVRPFVLFMKTYSLLVPSLASILVSPLIVRAMVIGKCVVWVCKLIYIYIFRSSYVVEERGFKCRTRRSLAMLGKGLLFCGTRSLHIAIVQYSHPRPTCGPCICLLTNRQSAPWPFRIHL
jgi:hypothetical protein